MGSIYSIKQTGKGTVKQFTTRAAAKAHLSKLLDKCKTFNLQHSFQHPYWIESSKVVQEYEVEIPLSDKSEVTTRVQASTKKEAITLATDQLIEWNLSKKIPRGLEKKVKVKLLTTR